MNSAIDLVIIWRRGLSFFGNAVINAHALAIAITRATV